MNVQSLTSHIAHMAHDALDDVSEKFEHGRDALVHTRDDVSEKLSSVFDRRSSRVRTIASVLSAYATVRGLARSLNLVAPGEGLLGLLRLRRQPSTFSEVARGVGLVAAGAAVGAGVALLLAPQSGAQTRKQVSRQLRSLVGDVESAVDDVGESLKTGTEGSRQNNS